MDRTNGSTTTTELAILEASSQMVDDDEVLNCNEYVMGKLIYFKRNFFGGFTCACNKFISDFSFLMI